jgi:RHS repeat-associated protein
MGVNAGTDGTFTFAPQLPLPQRNTPHTNYDTEPTLHNFSQDTWGRLSGVTFNGSPLDGASPAAYYYSYSQSGRVTKQRLHIPNPAKDFDATYAWDNQGRMTSQTYPTQTFGPSPLTYQYDAMGNLSAINQGSCAAYDDDGTCGAPQSTSLASATYTFSGQIATWNHYPGSLTGGNGYDSQLRLTSTGAGYWNGVAQIGMVGETYNYSATADNGRITSKVDGISGETVNYTYDAINRLASATATNGSWTQSYSYDGFGNLTGVNGAAVGGGGAGDANGNAAGYTWDVENRMVGGSGATYAYDPYGKRIEVITTFLDANQNTSTQNMVTFYGITGQRLQTTKCVTDYAGNSNCVLQTTNLYLGRKLIAVNGQGVATDRLGSVRGTVNGPRVSYFPYGQERAQSNGQTTADGAEKFGTYFRDSVGQDYADQRYYNSTSGRFLSADPSLSSNAVVLPGNWNRYAYVGGDPINRNDPRGLCSPNDDPPCYSATGSDSMPGSGVSGGGGGGETGSGEPCNAQHVPQAGCTETGVDSSNAEDPDPPVQLPKEICNQDVINAMKKSWSQTSNGTSGLEAGFRLDGTSDSYTIVESPSSNTQMKQSMEISPTTFDLFHVHPNKADPNPSPNDINIANKFGIDVFTMSSNGLFEYDPKTKTTVKLRNGLDWTKPCPQN